jgi:peptide/nickel transport system permease protein
MGSLPLVAAPPAVRSYVLGRAVATAATFVLATAVAYLTIVVLPVRWMRYLPSRTGGTTDLREQLGLDGPLSSGYLDFLWRFLSSGSTGTSVIYRDDTAHVVLLAAPVTAWIVAGGLLAALAVSLPLGLLSALHPGSGLSGLATGFVRVTASAHPVWIAMLIASLIAFRLELAPVAGYCDLVGVPRAAPCGGAVDWAKHLLLPWATLGALFGAIYTRRIREGVSRSLTRRAQAERALGASEARVRAHALRGAFRELAAWAPADLAVAVGFSLFVEQVFGLTGLGRVLVQAGIRFDLPLIAAVVLWAATGMLAIRLACELLAQLPSSQRAHSRS